MVVLGVDVGLKTTGYVVCEVRGSNIELIQEGQVVTKPSMSFPFRLFFIYQNLLHIVEQYSPEKLILERLYSHHKHPTTLGVLSQVRGVIVLLGQQYNLEMHEYSPTKARNALLGKGSVDSSQVKKMVEATLKREVKSEHIADAFSLVVVFSRNQKMEKILGGLYNNDNQN